MNVQQVTAIMELLSEAYPTRDVTEKTIAVYAMVWSTADADEMREAAIEYMRSGSEFFPSPGSLLQIIRQRDRKLAEEAWGEVMMNLDQVGYCGQPTWSSELIERCSRMCLGDWANWCRSLTSDSVPSHRSRFIATFNAIQRKEERIAEHERAVEIMGGHVLELGEGPDV